LDGLSSVFIRVWISRLISIIGTGITEFGIGVWIFDVTGKATPMALTLLCSILPSIVLGPLSGYLSDKYKRKNIIIIADSVAAIVSIFLFLYVKMFEYNIVVLCILTLISATANMFDENAYTASITTLVEKSNLKKANGMNQVLDSITTIFAPIIAGVLYYVIGLTGIIIIDISTYIISMLLFCGVESKNFSTERVADEGDHKVKENIWKGFEFIFSQKSLLLLLIYFTILNFLFNISSALIEPLSLSVGSSIELGIVRAFGGGGMLLGSLFITFSKSKFKPSVIIRGSVICTGIALLMMGITESIILVAIGRLIFSIFIPVASAIAGSLWMAKTPEEIQGRVTSARFMVLKCFMPISYILTGPLADYIIPNALNNIENNYFPIYSIIGSNAAQFRVIFMFAGLAVILTTCIITLNKSFKKLDVE